jgi:hypothetical protein
MHFDEAILRISAADQRLTEQVVPLDELTIEPDALSANGQRFDFTLRGFEHLCSGFENHPKVPSDYLRSLPSEMQAGLLHYHLGRGFGRGGSVTVFGHGTELAGVGRADLARLTGRDVAEAVLDGMGGRSDELDITRLSIVDDNIQFDAITERAQREVRPGDVVLAGVTVYHSLMADSATKVDGFLHRLVCSNGSIHRECLSAREGPRTRRLSADHPNARDQQRQQIRRLSSEALDNLNRRLDGLRRLTEEPADLRLLAMNWFGRSRLSARRLMPLLEQAHAEEGGENTAFGVMNAFTRVATHRTELSPNIRRVLARMGGMLAFGHSRVCPKCWSLIAASN